jgi:hypothetical protein
MIYLTFNIANPLRDTWTILWNKSGLIGKHKAWEFNGYRTNHIVNIDFHFNPVGDHGGIRAMLGLFGFDVELHFYDVRHWDIEKKDWVNYGQPD